MTEGYAGENSEYRGNGVTKYVLERIDKLDEKMDSRLDRIEGGQETFNGKLDSHLTTHAEDLAARKRRREQVVKAAQWIGGTLVALATAAMGARVL